MADVQRGWYRTRPTNNDKRTIKDPLFTESVSSALTLKQNVFETGSCWTSKPRRGRYPNDRHLWLLQVVRISRCIRCTHRIVHSWMQQDSFHFSSLCRPFDVQILPIVCGHKRYLHPITVRHLCTGIILFWHWNGREQCIECPLFWFCGSIASSYYDITSIWSGNH